jgi:hypothetical protein
MSVAHFGLMPCSARSAMSEGESKSGESDSGRAAAALLPPWPAVAVSAEATTGIVVMQVRPRSARHTTLMDVIESPRDEEADATCALR